MTRDDTGALRALREGATPGPWEHFRDSESDFGFGPIVENLIGAANGEQIADWGNGMREEDAAYIVALVNAADDLLDEIDKLRGQVARVEAWYGWRRGTDAPNEALAAPAKPAGVSRELIEQVRWAEANPNAVALDDVEAKRRRTAKSSSQQKRVREMGESDWSNVAPFDTESEIQQSRRTAEGGEHVHLFESDGCITVGCTTQVCAACGHVENPHIEGCKAAEGGE